MQNQLPNILVISNYNDFHTVRPEAEIFIGLAKLGFKIFVITYPNSPYKNRFEENGIEVFENHPTSKNDKESQKAIRSIVIEKKIDIAQLFNSKGTQNTIKATKGLKLKIVLYRGYSDHIHWYDPSLYFKYFHPRVDKIICNSIGVKQLFDKQPFFNPSKTVAINKGHKLEWYSHIESLDIRKELGIDKDALIFVNVGNNRKMKGIPYLLKAFNNLPKETNIHLLLIGRDMDNTSNINLLTSSENKKKVHFLGFRTDVLEIVAGSDVFVSSSITGESITKSVIESMALGTPAIITDIPGNVELVDDGVNGLVAKNSNSESLKNCMMNIYENQQQIEKFSANAKSHIQTKLNASKTVEEYGLLYKSLID